MGKKDFISSLLMCFFTAVLTLALVTVMLLNFCGGREGLAFISKLNTVRAVVAERYVGEVDWSVAADMASEAIVSATGDPWSAYMSAEERLAYTRRQNNSKPALGVSVKADAEGRGMLVSSVVEGSPAEKAGITPGCVITHVAGQNIAGMSAGDVSAIIKSLTEEYAIEFIDSEGNARTAMIVNEYMYSSPVSYGMLEGDIGYIRISNFEKGAGEDGIAAIESLKSKGADSLIFDVRTNPGGQLSELTALLDYLLPEGVLFKSIDAEGGEELFHSDSAFVDMPMAVLMNSKSYSAAEFFAAALSEYEAAVTVGEQSTGKARSQKDFVLSDGSSVHISTKNYLTPKGVNLAEEGGLVPDIAVAIEEGGDTQLEKAVEYLS